MTDTGRYWITDLASDDADFFDEEGKPTLTLFANAVQIWSYAQQRQVTVAEAAQAFRVPESVIVRAVEGHFWMFIVGDPPCIEHEGE